MDVIIPKITEAEVQNALMAARKRFGDEIRLGSDDVTTIARVEFVLKAA
jgi:hypothetical protein